MIKTNASHLDHHLTDAQVAYLLLLFADRSAFFIETVDLPPELGTVPCGLHGPIVGDLPVPDDDCTKAKRGDRAWSSRLVARPARPTSKITIIAGPHEGDACIVYTMFGGPLAPREPGDIRREMEAIERERGALPDRSPEGAEHSALYAKIVALRVKRAEADAFWSEHALSADS